MTRLSAAWKNAGAKLKIATLAVLSFIALKTAEAAFSEFVTSSLKDPVINYMVTPTSKFLKRYFVLPTTHFITANVIQIFAWIILFGLCVVVFVYKSRGDTDWYRRRERFKNFSDFSMLGVKFGFVRFFPTLDVDPLRDSPKGFGYDVLSWIFRNEKKNGLPVLETFTPELKWHNAIKFLNEGKYDVLATPFYELRERTKIVSFCSPLFYVDIGAFVPCDSEIFSKDTEPMDFQALRNKLSEVAKKMKIIFIPGELQDHFCHKYITKASFKEDKDDTFSIRHLLDKLCTGEQRSDIFFCERWQAERQDKYGRKNGFRNLLNKGSLLLPVGFAVRKSDDTLRKFINLQLLGMQRDGNRGTIDFLLHSFQPELRAELADSIKDCYYLGSEPSQPAPPDAPIVSLDLRRKS